MTTDVIARRTQATAAYFAAVDAGDRVASRAALSPDLQFRFANGEVGTGRDAPANAGIRLREVVTGMIHDVKSVRFDNAGEYAAVELDMTYHRKTGDDLRVPACVVMGFDESDRIKEYRIYVDASELGVQGAGPGMRTLDGQVAIITGAGGGLGSAQVRALHEAGASILVTDINEQAAKAVAAEFDERIAFAVHDVTDAGDWDRVMARAEEAFGAIDILVNNAAHYDPVGLLQTTKDNWDRHIAVVQYGTFLGIQKAAARDDVTAIVNIVSTVALAATPGMFAYQTAKSAVRGMSRTAAKELAPRIRVNAVFPGLMDTPMAALNGEEVNTALKARIPMGRMGHPAEVAAAVLYLVSPGAAFTTGTELVVDGGSRA